MRALGLPNTKHFHEITRIEDAIACASLILRTHPHPFADVVHRIDGCTVAEKLKQEGRAELSQAELTEELEDEEGNVYNRKVKLTFLASSSFHDTDPR